MLGLRYRTRMLRSPCTLMRLRVLRSLSRPCTASSGACADSCQVRTPNGAPRASAYPATSPAQHEQVSACVIYGRLCMAERQVHGVGEPVERVQRA